MSDTIHYVQNATGETVSAIVPIELWRRVEALLSAPIKDPASGETGTISPRLRDRPLTEEELREKAEFDRMADLQSTRLDSAMVEMQARSIPVEEW